MLGEAEKNLSACPTFVDLQQYLSRLSPKKNQQSCPRDCCSSVVFRLFFLCVLVNMQEQGPVEQSRWMIRAVGVSWNDRPAQGNSAWPPEHGAAWLGTWPCVPRHSAGAFAAATGVARVLATAWHPSGCGGWSGWVSLWEAAHPARM